MLLRPRAWIELHGIVAGQLLPLHLPELEVSGQALVTAVEACPPIAGGAGSVVTARFVTREVHRLVSVDLLGAGGELETLTGTPVHPVWSLDRGDWVPLAELTEGETLQGHTGPALVLRLSLHHAAQPVYTLEVHGEHVYQVGELGVLVHNACSATSGNNIAAVTGQKIHRLYKAGMEDNITTFKEYVIKGTRKKVDFLDIANGVIYELKPNNANAIAKGWRQARGYSAELKKLFPGINWTIVVDTY